MSLSAKSLYRALGSFLNDQVVQTGIAASSLSGILGFRQTVSDFENPQDENSGSQPSPSAAPAAIGAITTAGILSTLHTKFTPGMTALGVALASGAAYATGRIYGQRERHLQEAQNKSEPSLSSRLLEGAIGLGGLYMGGKALAPYVARSVYRMDQQFRPWFNAMGETINQAQLKRFNSPSSPGMTGMFSNYSDIFNEHLANARKVYASAQGKFPVNNYLHLINSVNYNITDTKLRNIGFDHVIHNLIKEHGIHAPLSTVNGLRSATLSDLLKSPQYSNIPGLRTLASQMAIKGIDYSSVTLGKGVMFDTAKKSFLNMSELTPGSIAWKAQNLFQKNFQVPFLGNPLGFLRLNEWKQAAQSRHQFHMFKPGVPLGPSKVSGPNGTAFIGGKLFDLGTNQEVTAGGILVNAGYWAKATDTTKRHFNETAFGSVLRQRYGAGLNLKAPEGKINIGNAYINKPTTWWQKSLHALELDIPFVYKTGFSQHESGIDKVVNAIKGQAPDSLLGTLKKTWNTFWNKDIHDSIAKENPTNRSKPFSAFPTDKWGRSKAFLPYSDVLGTTSQWLTERPVRLMEEMGFGAFDPRTTRSATDVIYKMVFKRFLPIYGAIKAAQLADDITGGFLSGSIANIGAGVAVGSSWLRDHLGITQKAQYLENLMPGSMTSPLAVGARAFGLPLMMGIKYGPKGAIATAALAAFLGGTGDITKSYQDTRDEYYGDKDVAIRAGRWWQMSAGSFEGNKIKEFAPNWYRRVKSRYKYTSTMYGSASEYWSHYLDPYHYGIKHYYDRPYPLATSGLEEVPFLGPFAANIVAPPMYMHAGAASVQGQGGTVTAGPGVMTGSNLNNIVSGKSVIGFDPNAPHGMLTNTGSGNAVSPVGPQGIAQTTWQSSTEYLGMYGFLAKAVKEQLTGTQNAYENTPVLASTTNWTGIEKAYWQANLGDPGSLMGGIGSTEFARRFIPKAPWNQEKVNNIPNAMPSWMPGSNYFKNFKTGDPYAKAGDYGEIRLPGEAYEKFHKPGAGIIDAAKQLGVYNRGVANGYPNYSILDQYRILGNVAPYSKEFKYSSQYIAAMSKAGMLTPEGEKTRKQLKEQFAQQKQKYKFSANQFSEGKLVGQDVTVSKYLGHGRFLTEEHPNKIYQLSSLSSITPEGESRIAKQIYSGAQLTVQALDDKRYQTKAGVNPTTPVLLNSLNRDLVTNKEAKYSKEGPADIYAPLNTKVQYGPIARGVGSIWEKIAHADIPLLKNKFLHQATPLEQYEKSYLYAPPGTSWYHPIRSYLEPILNRMAGGSVIQGSVLGGILGYALTKGTARKIGPIAGTIIGAATALMHPKGYVPERRKQQWETEQYYDILKYVKNQRLYEYTRQLAIDRQGIDPEKLIQSLEASKQARASLNKAIGYKESDLRIAALKNEGNAHSKTVARRQQLRGATQFLRYQKYLEDEVVASMQGTPVGAALKYHDQAASTMYGADLKGDFSSLLRALPKTQRDFFTPFLTAPAEKRKQILQETPLGMRRMLEAKWGMKVEDRPDLEQYFSKHHLPSLNSVAWHPAVNLEDVKLKTIQQEGCLLPNELISIDYYKYKPINLVKIGDTILSSDGTLKVVNNIMKKIYDGACSEIMLMASPFNSLKITDNHHLPYLQKHVNSNGIYKQEYGEVRDLRAGHKLLFPSIIFKEDYTKIDLKPFLSTTKLANRFYTWPESVQITTDLAEVFGWWLAEGSMLTKEKGLAFALNASKEQQTANFICSTLENTFGGKAIQHIYKDKNSLVINYCSKPIAKLFKYLMGCGSVTKKLSPEIFNMPIECIMAFLHGWQNGDGWDTSKEIFFSTCSKELATQIWYLLNSLGFKTRFQSCKPSIRSMHPSYRLYIGKIDDRLKFYRREFLRIKYFYVPIKRINKFKYIGQVYDIDIDNPDMYVTSIGIVHNSDMHDFGLWETQARDLGHKPYVPLINPFDIKHNPGNVKSELRDILSAQGYNNYELEVQNQQGDPSMNISMDIKYNTQPDAIAYINKNLHKFVGGANA